MADKTAIKKSAQKFLAKGQVDKAIAEWEKLLDTADATTFNMVGDLYLKKGDDKKAIENFHKAARVFRDEGFSLKGLAIYKKILNVDPTEADALFALGELNEEKGIITDAIRYYIASADVLAKDNAKDKLPKVYEKIISLAANNIPLRIKVAELFSKEAFVVEAAKEYAEVARLYQEKADVGNAEQYYKKAYDIHPNNRDVLTGLSGLYESVGKLDRAMEFIDAAVERLGEDKEFTIAGARLLCKMKSFDKAIERASQAINMDPDGIEAKKLLGDIYRDKGDMGKAWETYKPVIDEIIFKEMYEEAVGILNDFRNIDPVETSKKLIALYNQTGDSDAAFAELGALGDYFFEKGMMQDALNTFKEADQMKPGDGHIKARLGDIEKVIGVEVPKAEATAEDREGGAAASEGKSVDELLTEADIFIRYGLRKEAEKLLESIKVKAPDNVQVHEKLKRLYAESKNTELAVTECIVLSELYSRSGEADKRAAVVKEAVGINPDDPRLAERFGEEFGADIAAAAEPGAGLKDGGIVEPPAPPVVAAAGAEETEAGVFEQETEAGAPAVDVDSFDEEMAEADFYVKEGLYKEAAEILRGLSARYPDEEDLRGKLAHVEKLVKEELLQAREREAAAAAAASTAAAEEEEEDDFETVSLTDLTEFLDDEEAETGATPEPLLEDDVLGIFDEFKKGLEKELEDEDMETRYNLGIAYKEMGLIDDAINEFQTAKKDPSLAIQCQSMLGTCYGIKGLHKLSIDAFLKTLSQLPAGDTAFWGMKFELADAYDKNGEIEQAFETYTEIYGWDSKFRRVDAKINELKARLSGPAAEAAQEPVVEVADVADEDGTVSIDLSDDEVKAAEEEAPKTADKEAPAKEKTPKGKKTRVFYI